MNSSDIKITYNEEEHSITEWAELANVPAASIRARWNKSQKEEGWTAEQIIYGKAGAKIADPEKTPTTPSKKVSNIMSNIQNYLEESIAALCLDEVCEEAKPIIKQKLIDDLGFMPEIHHVKTATFEGKFEGITHERFDEVLQLVYNNIPVMLVGDAGTGKNILCYQISQALKIPFYFTNSVSQEHKITGFVDAYGKYHETEFFKAFTQGGLFFLDELDASIPEVLVLLNAALANRYFDFPQHGRVDAHKDFRVVSASNTFGTGADQDYTGRYCLDRASLDRFAMIEVDYSPKIEMSCSNNNEELCLFARAFRKAAKKASISCLFSYRSISRIAALESVLPSLSRVLEISLIKGLSKDDMTIIINNIKSAGALKQDNKYLKALQTLAE